MSHRSQASRSDRALAAFRAGGPVLVHDHDDREGETDLVYPADVVTPEAVARMRNDAGGLVCVALSDSVADAVDLPFLEDELAHPTADAHDLGYDDRSSFSLPVNHRDTFTGITDEDRARTITELASAASAVETGVGYGPEEFAAEFRAPGHVHVLRGAPDGLGDRRGHTELGLALAAAAERPPAVVVCEMLDDETGRALAPDAAREYARRHEFPYVEGADLVAALD
ncbi:3,4-dihydroxy-2-butanone-4-phosphate synthase [Candidatus Halobonum tyrrellensis]|uniref:3,4-dihydroxy-2-butanone 4-phosphate synthase n=1 Tax=Candidatus Halobonum tyrrellensis G22 TaxID=1324957 RepID=V4HMU3_9EURY|nr:3,4-dihydroxy-2-butanone-4-phosphate synthase [Candidatus Halobonum tyrrellensis]ESP89249.1 3,4-dihydroxy-2-butanone 4-phosphate synthase [Candidatus Halobonum tyrrellensis G22]